MTCVSEMVEYTALRELVEVLSAMCSKKVSCSLFPYDCYNRTTLVDITVRLQERKSSAPIVLRQESEPVVKVSPSV